MDKFDYIITGAGAAGLSLLMHLIHSGQSTGKKILLLEQEHKIKNDRTWCYWEKGQGLFEPIVYKQWQQLWFRTDQGSKLHNIAPYHYKLIRGIDFYNYCFKSISAVGNITVEYGKVEACVSNDTGTYVVFNGRWIHADFIFNSILFTDAAAKPANYYLLQHFKGWVVETREPVFDESQAILMDFRVEQKNGDTSFVYVMPFSPTKALVEYTVFSKALLDQQVYDTELEKYCKAYINSTYTVLEKEFGIIPMTDYVFPEKTNNSINIGTAGGQTKASSGYTFHFIQKQSRDIVESLKNTGKPFVSTAFFEKRFNWYDRTLLNILCTHSFPGESVFSILMNDNKMLDVLRFLDNETSLAEEIKLIRGLPKRIFLKAALFS